MYILTHAFNLSFKFANSMTSFSAELLCIDFTIFWISVVSSYGNAELNAVGLFERYSVTCFRISAK